ncbi:AAA family ATPase [Pseudomonadota bacterium]
MSKLESEILFESELKDWLSFLDEEDQSCVKVDMDGIPCEFSKQTEINVLLWCFRALDYCNKTNSLFGLIDGWSSHKGAFEGLIATCAPLNLPKAATGLPELIRLLPAIVGQLEAYDLPRDPIERSVDELQQRCGLSDAERNLLLFGITVHENQLLNRLIDRCFPCSSPNVLFGVLAHLLDVTVREIQTALRSDSFLSRTGLLELETRITRSIDGRLDLGMGLPETFEVASGDWETIVRTCCIPLRSSSLTGGDFDYMSDEWALVSSYLKGCVKDQRLGANILIYGAPGVGKTQFARALICSSGLNGYELVSASLQGHALNPAERNNRFRQANEFLRNDSPCVLLVDEFDGMLDVDWRPPSLRLSHGVQTKATATQQIESNSVPTVWIANDVHILDPAIVRRFDIVIRFKNPPRTALHNILESKLGNSGLTAEWLDCASRSKQMTPGLVNVLARTADSLKTGGVGKERIASLMETSLRQKSVRIEQTKPSAFRTEFCNPSVEIETLISFLSKKTNARCLLHGATGGGKTAFAKHIAEILKVQPRMVRPSDLLAPYVGETEQNIATIFTTSDPDQHLIILDEIEGYTANRSNLRHNWQVSAVNELLGQLEAYEGRVIASTNLKEYMDPAIRRRFQLKVELLPLNTEQRRVLLEEVLLERGCTGKGQPLEELDFSGLEGMTFGHIKNATEVAEFMSEASIEKFVALLKKEVESTNGRHQKPIGFIH